MKTCKACGGENPETRETCVFCGEKLEDKPVLLGSMGGKKYSAEGVKTVAEPEKSGSVQGTGLLGSMGGARYEDAAEATTAGTDESEGKPGPEEKPRRQEGTGLAGSMGGVRYGTKPKDPPPEPEDKGFAGSMGGVRYGTKPKDSPPEEPEEKKKRPDKGLILALALTVSAIAATIALVFWGSIFGGAEIYGMGLGGFINYYKPINEEELIEEDGISYVGDEIVVVSGIDVSYEEMESFFAERNMSIIGYVELIDTYQVALDDIYSLTELHSMARELEQDARVDSATINAVRESAGFAAPSDPWDEWSNWFHTDFASDNWGVMAIRAPVCWERYEPEEVRVGVIDSMFDENSEDLDFAMVKDNEIYRWQPEDDDKLHGSHVSGTIGAIHNNGLGVTGVAENCRLYGYSAFGYEGTIETVSAIAELAAQDVRVINYSMGYIPEVRDPAMAENGMERDIYYQSDADFSEAALRHLLQKGYDFVLVCSAGNDPVDALWCSEFTYIDDPEIRDRILVVGAAGIKRDGSYYQADWSALGSRVDVLAPGVDIYSTRAGGGGCYMSGTSMAAPHVSGVCASVWAIAPDLTGAEVKQIVVQTADIPVPGGSAGLVDMEAAMAAASR